MLGIRFSWLRASLLTFAGLLLASGVTSAHGGGHGGGGHGGGIGHVGGFGHGVGGFGFGGSRVGGVGLGGIGTVRGVTGFGIYGPGFSRGLGYGYAPIFGRGYNFGLGGYGRYGGAIGFFGGFGGYGFGYPFGGLGLPYLGYNAGWGGAYPYSYYGYGSRPYNTYSSTYPATPADYGITQSNSETPPPKDNMAHLLVIVPENADLWFNGTKTKQSGPQREFVSPELDPEKRYNYEVKVRWKENGKEVEQVRQVHVKANDWMTVDFTKPEQAPKAAPSAKEQK
jgi:uncharacterized protein (TIGR03000 family)